MKITVKDGKNFNLHLCFPTRIVLNRFTAFFLSSVLKKQNIHVTTEQILTFSKVLRKYKRKHPDILTGIWWKCPLLKESISKSRCKFHFLKQDIFVICFR